MKRFFSFAALLTSAVLLSGCALLYPNWGTEEKPSDSETPSASPSTSSSVEPSPTASESAAANKVEAKISIIDSMVDSNNGLIYAIAEVTNVDESTGTCTLTYEGQGVSKSVSAKAEANVTTTQCFPLELVLTGIPKGKGAIFVTYDSPTAAGSSSKIAVTIP